MPNAKDWDVQNGSVELFELRGRVQMMYSDKTKAS
jgi:hypothetical protein